MLPYVIYIVMLLLIFFMLFYSIYGAYLYMPLKIKVISCILILIAFLRIVSLLIFISVFNLKLLFNLRLFYNMNYIYIFSVIVLLIYIFIRSFKLKPEHIYIFSVSAFILYFVLALSQKTVIKFFDNVCYIAYFKNGFLYNSIYSIISAALFFICVYNYNRKNINKIGMRFLIFVCIIVLAENILKLFNVVLMPSYIFGDFFCIAAFIYALQGFRKQYKYKLWVSFCRILKSWRFRWYQAFITISNKIKSFSFFKSFFNKPIVFRLWVL